VPELACFERHLARRCPVRGPARRLRNSRIPAVQGFAIEQEHLTPGFFLGQDIVRAKEPAVMISVRQIELVYFHVSYLLSFPADCPV
jgi:hypothetical protein